MFANCINLKKYLDWNMKCTTFSTILGQFCVNRLPYPGAVAAATTDTPKRQSVYDAFSLASEGRDTPHAVTGVYLLALDCFSFSFIHTL